MDIYVHRANTPEAVQIAAEDGFGVEIDIRHDMNRGLVVSHDAHFDSEACDFDDILCPIICNRVPTLLNIKDSGVVDEVMEKIGNQLDLFVAMDLFITDALHAQNRGLRVLGRISEYEWTRGPFYGVWLDSFVADPEAFFIGSGGPIYFVSPELHDLALSSEFAEDVIRKLRPHAVCTDHPYLWEGCKEKMGV